MRKLFYRFIHWIRNKTHKPHHQLTARGLYACYYIVEKYINEMQPNDFNQDYEEMIDKKLATIEKTAFFYSFKNEDGSTKQISDSDKRDFAAQMVVVAMLYLCGEKDRETVYGYIKNDRALELIKGCIKEGLVF